ncbi:MAG: membrane protein [Gemmatimonadota bacterium]
MANQDTASTEPVVGPAPTSGELRPPYGAAAIAGLLVFGLYAVTLSRTTAFWDTSEYIATGHILGVPHPPGNPLFVVLAKAWSLLLAPLGLSVAVRINLFSALMSAGAHALWFLVVHHILRYFSRERTFRLVGAGAAVLVSATAFTVWNQSNVNEKVYTVSLLTIALLSWLAFRWQEDLGKGKEDNLLVLMVFILALSVGNHLMAFLAAPAIGLFILMVHPKTLLNWRLYIAGGAAALLGISIHLFLPLRAGLSPVINEAAPTCPDLGSSLTAIVTYGKAGCVALSEALNRSQYDKPPLLPRQAPLASQLANYLQYFDWQWARGMDGTTTVFANLRLPFTMLFTGLGVWGAVEHFRRDRASFVYVAALFGTLSLALVYYLNFKYGYSLQAPVANRELHEVRERDYFFIVSFSVWGLWAGVGIATLWKEAAAELKTTLSRTVPILGLALIPLVANWGWASRAWDYAARDWAYNLLMSVEPYGVLFTNGDNDTFPLWYLQEVEGVRQDVTVIVTSYLNTNWYTKQLRDLTAPCPEGVSPADDPTRIVCQRPYTAETTGAAYVGDPSQAGDKVPLEMAEPIRAPTRTILPLDDQTIDEVAVSYSRVERDQALRMGEINAVLRAGQLVYPWMQYALVLINEVAGERPVYFASSGNAASALGLDPYLYRQGLAFKLSRTPLEQGAPAGVMRMAPSPYLAVVGDWVDVPRTRALLDEVFVHRTGIPDEWPHWPDEATIGIPNYYAWAYLALTQAATQAGDEQARARYQERTETWTALGT